MIKECFILVLSVLLSAYSLKGQESQADRLLREEVSRYGQAEITIPYPGRTVIDRVTRNLSITSVRDGKVYITLSQADLEWFFSQKFEYKIAERPDTKGIITAAGLLSAMEWDSYPSYTDYLSIMQGFAATYPALCRLDTIGTSNYGKLVLALKISDNVNLDEPEPSVFYSSTIHGDELAGFVLMLRLADSLLEGYASSQRIRGMVDNLQIWINPLANPDGTYRTGNTISSPTRSNANGEDLNRNFPDPLDPSIIPEKETVDMMKFMRKHRFVLSANFHSGAEVVNYPWDRWLSKYHADDTWFNYISRAYADTVHQYAETGYLTGLDNGVVRGAVWYVIYGGRQDFITWELQGREVTVELDYTKQTPAAQLGLLWIYNRRSLLDYIGNALYGIHGSTKDSETMEPVAAKIFLNGYDKDSSHVYSDTLSGNFTRFLMPGSWILSFSAKGYRDTIITGVLVNTGQKTDLTVLMKPVTTRIDTTEPSVPLIFPNPAKNRIRCLLPYTVAGRVYIRIFGPSGMKYADYVMDVTPGEQVEIDVGMLPPGAFTITFSSGRTGKIYTGRFVITLSQ